MINRRYSWAKKWKIQISIIDTLQFYSLRGYQNLEHLFGKI